jgi:hypothetical protein
MSVARRPCFSYRSRAAVSGLARDADSENILEHFLTRDDPMILSRRLTSTLRVFLQSSTTS